MNLFNRFVAGIVIVTMIGLLIVYCADTTRNGNYNNLPLMNKINNVDLQVQRLIKNPSHLFK